MQQAALRPLTGIVVLNEYSNKYSFDMSASFRPLTGIKVLNRTTKNVNIAEKAKVSVPLRGLRFLTNMIGGWEQSRESGGFRPLSGIKVLNSKKYRSNEVYENAVSVPFRGFSA